VPRKTATTLCNQGINPSAQRVAIAQYVLNTDTHPSADQVWAGVRHKFQMVSRATVYNTLNLFVEKGLLRQFVLTEGKVVFDPNVEAHHHFIDESTGVIYDVAWEAVKVSRLDSLDGFHVEDYQVVMRGKKKTRNTGTRR
jgi:Fur family iron response transcriptional regulator